ETLKRKLVSRLALHLSANARIYNIYGTSECATVIPIGCPLPGYQYYILNDEMQAVNVDEIGEVFIS
ncbi:unnamed protein product, partial [Didymodactylos carnosus]